LYNRTAARFAPWAALYEIADVIRKALRDPEFIRLANEPDTDKSWRVEGEDTPESAHMRCVAEEAINAVLNRIKIKSIKGNVVSMDVVAAGHSDDRAILRRRLLCPPINQSWHVGLARRAFVVTMRAGQRRPVGRSPTGRVRPGSAIRTNLPELGGQSRSALPG
jgi:hypothetical protein